MGDHPDREVCPIDLRYLKPLRAQMDHPTFRRIYFSVRDTWERFAPEGGLPNASLLWIVMESDKAIAKEKADAAKPAKKLEKVT